MKALLLSAGLGTRLRPTTNVLPKPCIPFWGIPLSWYSLYLLEQVACRDIVVNLHHLPEKIKELHATFPDKRYTFSYSLEKDQPMGSGGALYYARHLLRGSRSFFAINSDEIFIPSHPGILGSLVDHHQKTQSLGTLLVTDHPELGKSLKPVWIDAQGLIRGFGEKPSSTDSLRPVHYTGYKIFSEDILDRLPTGESHIFHDTVTPALKSGLTVNTLFDKCTWWETGNLNSFLAALGEMIELVAEAPSASYLKRVFDFLKKDFDYDVICQSDVRYAGPPGLYQKLKAKGVVFVDHGATILNQPTLENTIVNHGCQVSAPVTNSMLLSEDQ